MRTAFLVLVVIVVVRMPAWSQEATSVGLKGPAHTVLTEEFSDADGTPDRSTGSTFDIYDRRGYQIELYRYKSDGSLWVHTIFERNGVQIFRSQTIGTAPFENSALDERSSDCVCWHKNPLGAGRINDAETFQLIGRMCPNYLVGPADAYGPWNCLTSR